MTKVTILRDSKVEEPKKKIEFISYLDVDGTFQPSYTEPHEWDNVTLLGKDYTTEGADLMFAYDNSKSGGGLYLGYFNDGVV